MSAAVGPYWWYWRLSLLSVCRARNWPAVVNGLAYHNTMNHLSSVTVGRHFRQSTSVAKVTRQQSNNIEQKREYCLLLSIFSRCVIIVVKWWRHIFIKAEAARSRCQAEAVKLTRSLGLGTQEYPLQAADALNNFLQSGPTRPQWACCIFMTSCLHNYDCDVTATKSVNQPLTS